MHPPTVTEIVRTGPFSWISPISDQLQSNSGSQKQGTNGDDDNLSSFWRFKNMEKSKPLHSVKLETLGHIPSSFTSFKKDAASMHCSTVRPRPSQMSRYSCKELPPALQRSAELDWIMAFNTSTNNSVNCQLSFCAIRIDR